MKAKNFPFEDLPREEALRELSRTYKGLDPVAFESYLYIRRYNDELRKVLEKHFERVDLTLSRGHILMILYKSCVWEKSEKGIAPSDLANRLGVTRGAMTGILDAMEADGLVQRIEHPEDRRSLLIKIGRKGRDKVETLLPQHFTRISRAMCGLNEKEHRQLQGMIRTLSEGLPEIFDIDDPR